MANTKKLAKDLATYFLSKTGSNVVQGSITPNQADAHNLGSEAKRFDTIYARQVVAEMIQGAGGGENADTVDNIHAAATPQANTLLALDGYAVFPIGVYPKALLGDGTRRLDGNMLVAAGVTIDGVDLSELESAFNLHDTLTALEAHGGDLGTTVIAGHLLTGGGRQDQAEITLNADSSYAPGGTEMLVQTDPKGKVTLVGATLGGFVVSATQLASTNFASRTTGGGLQKTVWLMPVRSMRMPCG